MFGMAGCEERETGREHGVHSLPYSTCGKICPYLLMLPLQLWRYAKVKAKSKKQRKFR
jgi:hypothetical protein